MRIGANSGSLPDHLRQFATHDPAGALVEAALEEVRLPSGWASASSRSR